MEEETGNPNRRRRRRSRKWKTKPLSAQELQQLRTNLEWELFEQYHHKRKRTFDGFEGCSGDARECIFDADDVVCREEDIWARAGTLVSTLSSLSKLSRGVRITAAAAAPGRPESSKLEEKSKLELELDTKAEAAVEAATAGVVGGRSPHTPTVHTGTADGRLRVSTKTQSLKLASTPVSFTDLFWRVPIIPYMHPREGVVKKELRVELKTDEEVEAYEARKRAYQESEPQIIVRENQYRRKYTRGALKVDVRRLNIGICQKELQCKKRACKLAFSNCFVLYLRWTTNGGESFEESHIKVFSTGQIDLPGITDPVRLEHLQCLLHRVLVLPMQQQQQQQQQHPQQSLPLPWSSALHAVLINSDFLCNFQIDREALRDVLLNHYGIKSMSQIEQPGLRCPLYIRRTLFDLTDTSTTDLDLDPDPESLTPLVLDPDHESLIHNAKGKKGKIEIKRLMTEHYFKITCTFFRTGKVLVSGACSQAALQYAFRRMRLILLEHYPTIRARGNSVSVKKAKKTHYVSKCKHQFDFAYYATHVLGGPPPHLRF